MVKRPEWRSVVGHGALDPVYEAADFGVDPVQVLLGAVLAPAHHAGQEPGLLVVGHHGAAAVALTGVSAARLQPGAEHVPGGGQGKHRERSRNISGLKSLKKVVIFLEKSR